MKLAIMLDYNSLEYDVFLKARPGGPPWGKARVRTGGLLYQ